ncbi:hypothetical protein [Streptomyces bobili]|uniref:hypothetical protein n=1 Tax=Streptomyces bobili TaxID=67280 RepID=UPI000A3C31E0|nr:hypothetical protein [Streptomyces bobili]
MRIKFVVNERQAKMALTGLCFVAIGLSGYALKLAAFEVIFATLTAVGTSIMMLYDLRHSKENQAKVVFSVDLRLPGLQIPERATGLAALMAGKRRNVGSTWLDDLRGDPENGDILTAKQKRHKAAGFLLAAVRFRAHDWLGWTWAPVDWVLKTRGRREAFVGLVSGSHVIYIVHSDGLHTLLTYGWAWVGAAGGAAWWALHWLGTRRGIALASKDDPVE